MNRRDQLARARTLLGTARLLTVLGPGGVGKSRFTLRLVNSVRRMYADDVHYVQFSSVVPGGSVADEVATTLGLSNMSRDQGAEVVGFFADRRGILVLDGCEHVIEGAAELVRRILDACPDMSIVATSQIALRLSAEVLFHLDPLAVPGDGTPLESSAVQLYLDRARLVEPGMGIGKLKELAEISEICRRLEGMPLAIELAANRSRVLSSRQILDRLQAPLAFLTRGDRDLPPRQRTLKATIAWSYELCTADERELWRLVSVFTSPFDIDAVAGVWGEDSGSPRVLDTVESLLDKSILFRRAAGAVAVYAMLDTVRQFGRAMSSPDEWERVQAHHRDWHLTQLMSIEAHWRGGDQEALLVRAHRYLPDLRVALEFSIGRGEGGAAASLLVTAWRAVWQSTGRLEELRRWGVGILSLSSPETAELCQLRAVIATVEVAQGDLEACFRHLDDAQTVAEQLNDHLSEAMVAAVRAYVDPDPRAKVRWYERALELQGGTNQLIARADIEERLATAYDQLGEAAVAAAMRASLVERANRSGEKYDTSNMLMNAGITALARGEWENATALLRESLALRQSLGVVAYTAITEEGLAIAAVLGRDFPRAATLLGSAHSLWQLVGDGDGYSPLRQQREEAETRALQKLGARAFAAALRRGREFSPEAGIAFSLGQSTAPTDLPRSGRVANPLTARETEIATLVARGMTDQQIAAKLVISRRTAQGHVARSLTKLGFTSRVQLATWMLRQLSQDSSA